MGIKDLHDKVTRHARIDLAVKELKGMVIAIDASPYCIKAWYNDVPSFLRPGATPTHSYRWQRLRRDARVRAARAASTCTAGSVGH